MSSSKASAFLVALLVGATATFSCGSSSSGIVTTAFGADHHNPFYEYMADKLMNPPDRSCDKSCFKSYLEDKFERDRVDGMATQKLADDTAQHFSTFRIAPDISRLYHQTPQEDLDELDGEAEGAVDKKDRALLSDFLDDVDFGNDANDARRKMAAASHQQNKKVPSRRFLIPQAVYAAAEEEHKQHIACGSADPMPTSVSTENGRSFFGASSTVWEGDAKAYGPDGNGPNNAGTLLSSTGSSSAVVSPNVHELKTYENLRALPVTTGECSQCSDNSFVTTALAAEDSCAEPLALLEKTAGSAGSDLETDLAWSAFCSSECFMKMSQIPLSHYCCLGDTAPAFLNIMMACKTSTQPGHEQRYCGAEISNLQIVGCNYTTENECRANGKYCEWYANQSTCLFRATQENLDYICTDCARSYLELFPAGGIYNLTVHAGMGGVYGAFCNKIQDQYCYLTSANMGYRMAQNATSDDYVSVCKKDEQSVTTRLCHRVTAIRTSEAIRRRSLETWKYCNASSAADIDCDYESAGGFLLGFAMEKAAMLMCSNDPSSRGGMICPRVVHEQINREACTRPTFETGVCSANCDYKVRNAATRMGCCGPVFGQGGFEIAYKAPYPTRYMIGASALGLAYINNQSFEATPGVTRPPRTNSDFAIIEERAERLTNANSFAGFANCSSFLVEFAFWTQNITKCVQTPSQRTYYIRLHLNYGNLQNCVNRDFVYSALKADIAAVTGIARPQIIQTYIAEDKDTSVMMVGSRRTYSGLLMVLTVQSDSDQINQAVDANILYAKKKGRFIFPTAGPEIMMNCPNVMPNSHTPLFVDMWPALVRGNAPILKNSAPASVSFGNMLVMTLATLAAAMCSCAALF